MACEISGSSYLSCSHWFMLHTYAHRQLKLSLVNDFTGSDNEQSWDVGPESRF